MRAVVSQGQYQILRMGLARVGENEKQDDYRRRERLLGARLAEGFIPQPLRQWTPSILQSEMQMIIPILRTRKPRHREGKRFRVHGLSTGQPGFEPWQSGSRAGI